MNLVPVLHGKNDSGGRYFQSVRRQEDDGRDGQIQSVRRQEDEIRAAA